MDLFNEEYAVERGYAGVAAEKRPPLPRFALPA